MITSKLMKYAIAVLFVIGLCACDRPVDDLPKVNPNGFGVHRIDDKIMVSNDWYRYWWDAAANTNGSNNVELGRIDAGLEVSPFATIPTNFIGLGYSGLAVTNSICIGVGAGLYNTQFSNLLLLGRDIEPTDHNQIVIRGMSGKIYRYPLEFLIPEPVDFGDMGVRLEPKPTGHKSAPQPRR